LDVATLGPLGALACDADGLGEVASAVGDGEAGGEVVSAAGVADGGPLWGTGAGQGEQPSGSQHGPPTRKRRFVSLLLIAEFGHRSLLA
jgi:hypothetical protein